MKQAGINEDAVLIIWCLIAIVFGLIGIPMFF